MRLHLTVFTLLLLLASHVSAAGKKIEPAPGTSISQLRKDLKNPDADVRASAADELGKKGPTAQEAVADLIVALTHDPNDAVRDAAAAALGKMGKAAKAAAPALTKSLEHKSADLRETAAFA